VEGLNSYDAAESRRRAYRITRAFLAAADDWEASGRVRFGELVVAVNGDLVTGVIHGLDRYTDAANAVQATIQCGVLLAQVLRDLAGRFPRVRAYGTVGNHGRRDPRTKRPDPKNPTDSLDWAAYAVARELLRDVKNLQFNIPDSLVAVYEVMGRRVYQGHGDAIRQQLGTIGYGLTATVSRLGTTMARIGKPIDMVLFGHWHKKLYAEINGVHTYVNRSLIGTTELGFTQYGEIAIPGQEVYVVDPQLGPLEEHSIYATGDTYTGEYPPAY
jgi:hypothetical protein